MQTPERKVMKIKDIKPYPLNNKIHNDKNVAEIAKSIEEFGYLSNIGVDENGVILYGEGRFMAMKSLGHKEIEVQVVSHLTESKKRAFRIVDNKLSDDSVYDREAIQKELEWLMENDYNSELSMLAMDIESNNKIGMDAIDDELEEARKNDAFMDSLSDPKPFTNKYTNYERRQFEKGDVVTYRSLVIEIGDIPKEVGNACVITNKKLDAGIENGIVFVSGDLSAHKNMSSEPLIWHKGGANFGEGVNVLYDCASVVLLRGTKFTRRRYNNLVTALPNKESPNTPPAALFEDLLQNLIPLGMKVYSDVFVNLGIAGVTTGVSTRLFFKSGSEINDTLEALKIFLGGKDLNIKINEEDVVV